MKKGEGEEQRNTASAETSAAAREAFGGLDFNAEEFIYECVSVREGIQWDSLVSETFQNASRS